MDVSCYSWQRVHHSWWKEKWRKKPRQIISSLDFISWLSFYIV